MSEAQFKSQLIYFLPAFLFFVPEEQMMTKMLRPFATHVSNPGSFQIDPPLAFADIWAMTQLSLFHSFTPSLCQFQLDEKK